jgi:putative transposase
VRKRAEVDPVYPGLPVARQCELLDLSRSTFYYLPTSDGRLNQEQMRRMGLEAIYRKPRLSLPGRQYKRYPYILKGMTIDRPDHAWCSDITYLRLAHGFVYLVAILDWHSRYVLAWSLSTTLEKEFCLGALRDSLWISRPEVFNTDCTGTRG